MGSSRYGAATLAGGVEVVKRVAGNYFDHRMGTYAAALAYRGLFALFPFMLLLVVLVGVFGPPDAFGQLVEEVKARSAEQVPQQLEPVVEQGREQIRPLEDMARQAQQQSDGGLFIFGVAVAMWSISALASTLADAFNAAHGLAEIRRWWKVQALSLASGPLVALAVIVAVLLMLVGTQAAESVAEVLGTRELFVLLWGWLRYPLALALLWVALMVVYRYSPAVTQPLRSVWLGAALAVVAWAIATVAFSIYLAKFANFGVTYGSLGAAVGLLVYLNLSASIVLAGAELNAEIHPSSAEGTAQAGRPDQEPMASDARRTGDA